MTAVRSAVKGLVERDGDYLFLEQDTGDGHAWVLPGGGVEFGESFEDALEREIREETTLAVDVGDVAGAYTFSFPAANGEAVHVCATVFHCTPDAGTVDFSLEPEGEPITDHRWIPEREIGEYDLGSGLETLF